VAEHEKNQKDQHKNEEKEQSKKANTEAQAEENEHVGYVEEEKPKDEDNKVRAVASDPDGVNAMPGLDGMPEGDNYVGVLEHMVNPDPADEVAAQQRENYPRIPEEYFDPQEVEPEEIRAGHSATSRSVVGRVVVIEEDCIHDGEVYKAGVQDISAEAADALMGEGLAWEPAGKKRGR
jgi:hypothetical protein